MPRVPPAVPSEEAPAQGLEPGPQTLAQLLQDLLLLLVHLLPLRLRAVGEAQQVTEPVGSSHSEQVIIIFVFLALLQDILHSQENVSQIIVICKSRLGNFACF